MGDWQSGNLGRLNAAIQAQAEAGRIKESKKNRFASIAEGLTNNLFKRQSETAAQQHERKMQNLMYGEGVYAPEGSTATQSTTRTPENVQAPGGDYATFMQQMKPENLRSSTVTTPGSGVGLATGSQMKLNQQNADLEAASRSRSFEEYQAMRKRMGLPGAGISEQDYIMGWAPGNYYDAYKENEKNSGNLYMYLDAAFRGTAGGPAQFLSKDAEGDNVLAWDKFIDPKTGVIDEKKVSEAKAAMTTWLEGAANDDPNIARLFPVAQRKDSVKRYIENIFNQARGTAQISPEDNKNLQIEYYNKMNTKIREIKEAMQNNGKGPADFIKYPAIKKFMSETGMILDPASGKIQIGFDDSGLKEIVSTGDTSKVDSQLAEYQKVLEMIKSLGQNPYK